MGEIDYIIGTQTYVYGHPMMDLHRTFWENCLDPGRGHVVTLNQFIHPRRLVTPSDTWGEHRSP